MNAQPLDRRGFLSVLGFTAAGCLLLPKLGWLANILQPSQDDALAAHIWKMLGCTGPQHTVFFRTSCKGESAHFRSITYSSDVVTRTNVVAEARAIEALPGFDGWMVISPRDPQDRTEGLESARACAHVDSFFYGPSQAFDEEARRRGMNVTMLGQDRNRLQVKLPHDGHPSLWLPLHGDTVAERIESARERVPILINWA